MGSKPLRARRFWRVLAIASAVLITCASAAAAIESEGELLTRTRLVGNLGVAHGDIGVYPDRSATNPAPEPTGGSTVISVPAGAEIVESIVYWAGRGPGWADPNIVINGTSVDANTDYHWTGPGWDQSTYVADLAAAGVAIAPGENTMTVTGVDQGGERFYGIGFLVVYEHPSLPEVELQLLEGNEFAFYLDTYFDEVGESAIHSTVNCTEFAPGLEARQVEAFTRIMGVDAGRGDGPPRSQRLQWWTEAGPVATPIDDGLVGIPPLTPEGSVDNPTAPKVAPTAEWGSDTLAMTATLAAGETHHCVQLQSVNIGDGAGASLSITNQGGFADTLYRLGNLVWFDTDGNGMADQGEPGIDGVTVEIWRDGEDTPLATTTTSDNGAYLFEGLPCGTYRVSIPGGQSGWTINGDAVDSADLVAGAINNADANDDTDNDNNGVETDGAITSGIVQIGDCGEDGDYADDASNEPTNEVDRVGGPDDDPDDVPVLEGNYDDVRSNVSVDFSFEGDLDVVNDGCTPNADGTFPDGATDENGDPCTTAGTDDVCDADGNIVTDGQEGVDGNSADNCVTVVVEGEVECPAGSARAGETVEPGESCDDDDGSSITVEVEGQVEENDTEPLAVTGITSALFVLGGLMVLVIGAWFIVASAWFRPRETP